MVWVCQLPAKQDIHLRRISSVLIFKINNMKTYIKYIIPALIIGAIRFVSCKKLDLDAPGRLSTTIFWKTEADANLALTGLYGTLYTTGDVYHNGPFWWDNFSDNSYSQHNLGGGQDALISGL